MPICCPAPLLQVVADLVRKGGLLYSERPAGLLRKGGFFTPKYALVPLLGVFANLMMLLGVIVLSFKAGGSTSRDTTMALVMVLIWLIIGIIWFIFNTRNRGHEIFVPNQRRPHELDDFNDLN